MSLENEPGCEVGNFPSCFLWRFPDVKTKKRGWWVIYRILWKFYWSQSWIIKSWSLVKFLFNRGSWLLGGPIKKSHNWCHHCQSSHKKGQETLLLHSWEHIVSILFTSYTENFHLCDKISPVKLWERMQAIIWFLISSLVEKKMGLCWKSFCIF